MAQRLVRLLCPHCKKEGPFSVSLFPPGVKLPFEIDRHYVAQGCESCFYTGYSGRKAIYELIPVDADTAEKIKNNEFSNDTLQYLRLKDTALSLFREGKTSFSEIVSYLI